jgi:(E)-4-hydroxy-3-methylbut-2-enyl-diphosphate synthase
MTDVTRKVRVGDVEIGGGAPVSVQSMTGTHTSDVAATVAQIGRLVIAGADIVRVAVPDHDSALAIRAIKSAVTVPIVADIHFDHRLAIASVECGADKLRINPGNIGSDRNVIEVAQAAKAHGVPIRIGVNAGSIDRKKYGPPSAEALVASALDEAAVLERFGFEDIVLSLKAFDVPTMIRAYELAAHKCSYPLHLGVTEAGAVWEGSIRSAVGIGALLHGGIGDTMRVSLTGDPVEEVRAGIEILASLRLRQKAFTLISCPTCGRCDIDLQSVAAEVKHRLETRPPAKPITVAVMGCIVNGPGEACDADVGVAGGRECGALFVGGKLLRRVPESELVDELMKEIDELSANTKS